MTLVTSAAQQLAAEQKNTSLLKELINAALASKLLKESFRDTLTELEKINLHKSPFVVTAVIGQELLAQKKYDDAASVLESALRIGSTSLKLKGSVFSALCSAHWALSDVEKAIACMQQDLAISKCLGDLEGECRAHGNLGAAHFSQGYFKESLQHHRFQLVVAMRLCNRILTTNALSSLGHVYTAIGDYSNALASHKQCVLLARQASNKLVEAREIGNVGSVYLACGQVDNALECHYEHLKLAKLLNNKYEEARANCNLGCVYYYMKNYSKCISYYEIVLQTSCELEDKALQSKAYACLGHAKRCMHDYEQAMLYHEKQLDCALEAKDRAGEGRACTNLSIIYQYLNEHQVSLKLLQSSLESAKHLGDRASQARIFGNIGNSYSSLGQFDTAVYFHKQGLTLSTEVCDRHSECSIHGNIAVAYQALRMKEKALYHYSMHYDISRTLFDNVSEARAVANLGNFYCLNKMYTEAIPLFEKYLILSQEINDVEKEIDACNKLGYCQFSISNFKEAVRYYEQTLSLSKDINDVKSVSRAYCNLGLAFKDLGNLDKALDFQEKFLALAISMNSVVAKFSALGNIGEIFLKQTKLSSALQIFNEQLAIAKVVTDRSFEVIANRNLGFLYRRMNQHDKALGYHTNELMICQELGDIRGECRSHGNIGNIHLALGNYLNAFRCYEEQMFRARDIGEVKLQGQAYGNLGVTKVSLGQFDEAIGLFEQQLAMIEQTSTDSALHDKGKAYSNLGDCYEALGDFEEAIKCYEQYLAVSKFCNSDKVNAYRGLGNAHRAMGNLQQALVCFEKRLFIAHELHKPDAICSAYGELGCLHSLLGNFEQAITCLQHQFDTANAMANQEAEGEAACGLGGVYQQMGEYNQALKYHQTDLDIASSLSNSHNMCRAHGNLGLSFESLGQYDDAIYHQKQHLSIATTILDDTARTLALTSLGRIYHALGKYDEAVQHFNKALCIAESRRQKEDEAKICHRLGLAYWAQKQPSDALEFLYRATALFENIRRESSYTKDYKLSMYDLQTASYQLLQQILVGLQQYEEALVVAERGRTRSFVDLLMERQQNEVDNWIYVESKPVSFEQIFNIVKQQNAMIIYYSIAANSLYTWILTPEKGISKFSQSKLDHELGVEFGDNQSILSNCCSTSSNAIDNYVMQVREFLGIDSQLPSRHSGFMSLMNESETDSELNGRNHRDENINEPSDNGGYSLRMNNRNHQYHLSNLSTSSSHNYNFSLGSKSGSIHSKCSSNFSLASFSSTVSNNKHSITSLYDLLIAPVEDVLTDKSNEDRDLVFVLQGDLYLVPFALLRKSQIDKPLFRRFNLLMVPCIRGINLAATGSDVKSYNPHCCGSVVIGDPQLPQILVDQCKWFPSKAGANECVSISEMMGCRPLTGSKCTKKAVLDAICKAEVLHFATHVSWRLCALVVSPGENNSIAVKNINCLDISEKAEAMSNYLLTAADILNIKINARLVVINSSHTDDDAGKINTDGVVGLTRAFLAAGAKCVMFSLWPVPEMACKIHLQSFYSSLLQGYRASYALTQAMKAVEGSGTFSHASNWAGWMLIGANVQLFGKSAQMGHALCQLLRTPAKSREAMRVVLHLVEKSRQRIHLKQKSPMYTTQQSIENKVADSLGWKDLLSSVGFQFEPAGKAIPAAVFFPVSDPGDHLSQCSACLQALLGLSVPTLTALSKMTSTSSVGKELIGIIETILHKISEKVSSVTISVAARLWSGAGCHELLASLGIDLVEVERDEVLVKAGKQANKRILQFAHQALVAVFDTHEAPHTLVLDTASNLESSYSVDSDSSTTSISQNSRQANSRIKSFFNPAEVTNLASASKSNLMSRGGGGRSDPVPPPDLNMALTHMSAIRQKYSSPSDASDVSDTNAEGGGGQSRRGAPAQHSRPGDNIHHKLRESNRALFFTRETAQEESLRNDEECVDVVESDVDGAAYGKNEESHLHSIWKENPILANCVDDDLSIMTFERQPSITSTAPIDSESSNDDVRHRDRYEMRKSVYSVSDKQLKDNMKNISNFKTTAFNRNIPKGALKKVDQMSSDINRPKVVKFKDDIEESTPKTSAFESYERVTSKATSYHRETKFNKKPVNVVMPQRSDDGKDSSSPLEASGKTTGITEHVIEKSPDTTAVFGMWGSEEDFVCHDIDSETNLDNAQSHGEEYDKTEKHDAPHPSAPSSSFTLENRRREALDVNMFQPISKEWYQSDTDSAC